MNRSTTPDASAGPREVDRLLAHYGESHQNPTNELIHFIAIPLIMLSLVGMMFALHPWVAYFFCRRQHGVLPAAVTGVSGNHAALVGHPAGAGARHG